MTFFTPGFTHALDGKRSKNKLWANFFGKLERKKEHVGEVNTFHDYGFWGCTVTFGNKVWGENSKIFGRRHILAKMEYDSSLKCFWAWCAISLISKINILGKKWRGQECLLLSHFHGLCLVTQLVLQLRVPAQFLLANKQILKYLCHNTLFYKYNQICQTITS